MQYGKTHARDVVVGKAERSGHLAPFCYIPNYSDDERGGSALTMEYTKRLDSRETHKGTPLDFYTSEISKRSRIC